MLRQNAIDVLSPYYKCHRLLCGCNKVEETSAVFVMVHPVCQTLNMDILS